MINEIVNLCDDGRERKEEARGASHFPPYSFTPLESIFLESISNPLLKIPHLPSIAEAAHAMGASVIVDATFATPYVMRPIAHGADACALLRVAVGGLELMVALRADDLFRGKADDVGSGLIHVEDVKIPIDEH